ncbi:MAG: hypothetical protein IJZ26_01865, partial [Clostridia bacterium]|nr:hypothetical protein [Clostridia bacterium]
DNGNGRITTRYKEVNGISQISTNTGSVTAILPFSETNPFTLNWKSEKNVDIRFGSCQPKAGDANIKEGSYNWNTTSNDGTIMLNSVSGIIKVRQIGDE